MFTHSDTAPPERNSERIPGTMEGKLSPQSLKGALEIRDITSSHTSTKSQQLPKVAESGRGTPARDDAMQTQFFGWIPRLLDWWETTFPLEYHTPCLLAMAV